MRVFLCDDELFFFKKKNSPTSLILGLLVNTMYPVKLLSLAVSHSFNIVANLFNTNAAGTRPQKVDNDHLVVD